MNSNEITLNTIEREYNRNNIKINDLEFKIKSLNGADIEHKGTGIATFGVIPWIVSVLSTTSLIKSGAIPIEWITALQVAVPATIGYGCYSLLQKKYKIKENLATFTEAKTQREVVLERARYEVEQANLKDINTMFSHLYKTLSSKYRLLTTLESDYDITAKNVNDLPSQEELASLEKCYETQLENLKIASTRKYLGEKYARQRDALTKVIDYALTPLASYAFSLMLIGAPAIMHGMGGGTPSTILQLEVFGIPAAISATSLIYLLSHNHIRTAAFKELNEKLGTSALPARATYDENLKDELYSAIIDAENAKQKLEEARRRYETLTGLPLGSLSTPPEIEENVDTLDHLTSSEATPEYQSPQPSDVQEKGKKLRKIYPSYGDSNE